MTKFYPALTDPGSKSTGGHASAKATWYHKITVATDFLANPVTAPFSEQDDKKRNWFNIILVDTTGTVTVEQIDGTTIALLCTAGVPMPGPVFTKVTDMGGLSDVWVGF